MGAIFHDLTGLTKEELCSVCGRPPHPCDDPECVPPTKEIYRRLIHCLAENGFLRADRDAFAEAFYLLWLSSDRDEWDGKAVEHFDALMDKACSYGEAKNKMPNDLANRRTAASSPGVQRNEVERG